MTLMAHFADAEKPDGIADAMARIEQAAEGLDCPRSLSNSAATLWHPEAHITGCVRGSFCTARRRRASGRISPTAA
jgi:alanine racemase